MEPLPPPTTAPHLAVEEWPGPASSIREPSPGDADDPADAPCTADEGEAWVPFVNADAAVRTLLMLVNLPLPLLRLFPESPLPEALSDASSPSVSPPESSEVASLWAIL